MIEGGSIANCLWRRFLSVSYLGTPALQQLINLIQQSKQDISIKDFSNKEYQKAESLFHADQYLAPSSG